MDRARELKQEIQRLRKAIEEAEASLPAHSVRPHQLMRIEELEEELSRIQKKLDLLESE